MFYALIFQVATTGSGSDATLIGPFPDELACGNVVTQMVTLSNDGGRLAHGSCSEGLTLATHQLNASGCTIVDKAPAVGPLPAAVGARCARRGLEP
jgi:hypothetical protein